MLSPQLLQSLQFHPAQTSSEKKERNRRRTASWWKIHTVECSKYSKDTFPSCIIYGSERAPLHMVSTLGLDAQVRKCATILNVKVTTSINTSRLKEQILIHVPGLEQCNSGCDVHLAFGEDVGHVLKKAHKKILITRA